MKSKTAIAAFAASLAMCLPASADVMQLTVTGHAISGTVQLPPSYSTLFSGSLSDAFVLSVHYDTDLGLHYSSPMPSGAERLLVAELIARNLEGSGKNFGNSFIRIPRITEELCLPTFEYNMEAPYAWPRR
jgi:hypothetical protein